MDTTLKATLCFFAFAGVAYLAGNKDVPLLQLSVLALAILAIISWLLSTFVVPFFDRRQERELRAAIPETSSEEIEQRRQEALERISSQHDDKTQQYASRQSDLQQKKIDAQDKSLHQFSPAWRSQGEALTAQSVHKRKNASKAKSEISIEMEAEPAVDSVDVTAFSVRLPNGAVRRRRFTATSSIQQLHAFIESCGYPPSRFAVYTLRPRQLIEVQDEPLSSLSPGKGLALVVEERDDSDDE